MHHLHRRCGIVHSSIVEFDRILLQRWQAVESLHLQRSGWQYDQEVIRFYQTQFISPESKIRDLREAYERRINKQEMAHYLNQELLRKLT